MNEAQVFETDETAQKAAAIVTKIVGFPYTFELLSTETTAWEVYSDDKLFDRIMKERYGSCSDLSKVGSERYKKMQNEIGMDFELSRAIDKIRYERNNAVCFESTIMVDIGWSLENDAFLFSDEAVPELDDPKNWPKWRRKIPVTIKMLKECHEVAQDVSEKTSVKIVVRRYDYPRGNDDYAFQTSFNAKNMTQDQFLKEIEQHCKAMVEAYMNYEPWLTGSEYRKMIEDPKHIKRVEKRWERMEKHEFG